MHSPGAQVSKCVHPAPYRTLLWEGRPRPPQPCSNFYCKQIPYFSWCLHVYLFKNGLASQVIVFRLHRRYQPRGSALYYQHTAVFEINGAPCTRCAHFGRQVHNFKCVHQCTSCLLGQCSKLTVHSAPTIPPSGARFLALGARCVHVFSSFFNTHVCIEGYIG